MRTPPRDDLRLSDTTGVPHKKWFIGVEVVVHPLLKKILDLPLELALERKYQ